MPIRIGLIGKTNTGKTTFFNAATLQYAEVSSYPFTTKQPNYGTTYAITPCVCREFNVQDNPRNSLCIEGYRHIPIELIDLPGLIKGAWAGKGLGNQFLSVASQADALIHVVDASGSVDEEGKITKMGVGNPLADFYDIQEELVMWLMRLIDRQDDKIVRNLKSGKEFAETLAEVLQGIKVNEYHIEEALKQTGLRGEEFDKWTMLEDKKFAEKLLEISKPMIVLANKMDLETAGANFNILREELTNYMVIPASAEAELALRRAVQKGYVRYIPGEEDFKIVSEEQLTQEQKKALEFIQSRVFGEYMRTGVQFAINVAVFKLLGMGVVYPVSDPAKLADRSGKILPDAYLMPPNSTVRDLARTIHSELEKGLLYAIDVRSGLRLPGDYRIKDRDVLSIVSTTRRAV
ncbi:MAG: redox-regulated ATPase YchF [Candidatus Caldarchaeum sp.]|nr:redox-regulated ATPase YchF [Candidatus Caldarchaeum sp.]MCX8200535.1 redox-regulated ATPase YchF [Candidatus Caldarchaeum sp.]MDW8063189.1 redox-regulated ATPase YchF [Candidatus Caldarchaeum sp.]MDW8434986.1 redox-regulated ATPase YchF [Candidatus Caldarchaeum sp.]